MKLICSIFMLLLVGCAAVAADQLVVDEPIAVAVQDPVPVESQEEPTAEWQVAELLDLLATQEVMLEALYGELMAYQEGGGDYGYVYEVKPGQSLWMIADEVFGDPYKWVTIYSMSCFLMEGPDLIYPGQVLVIP